MNSKRTREKGENIWCWYASALHGQGSGNNSSDLQTLDGIEIKNTCKFPCVCWQIENLCRLSAFRRRFSRFICRKIAENPHSQSQGACTSIWLTRIYSSRGISIWSIIHIKTRKKRRNEMHWLSPQLIAHAELVKCSHLMTKRLKHFFRNSISATYMHWFICKSLADGIRYNASCHRFAVDYSLHTTTTSEKKTDTLSHSSRFLPRFAARNRRHWAAVVAIRYK